MRLSWQLLKSACALEANVLRFVESHISRKTSEMWGTQDPVVATESWPSASLSDPTRGSMHRRKCLARGLDRELNILVGVSGAEESRFELRGGSHTP